MKLETKMTFKKTPKNQEKPGRYLPKYDKITKLYYFINKADEQYLFGISSKKQLVWGILELIINAKMFIKVYYVLISYLDVWR